jgi:membrane protease YdiL (CAAX protease family)
MAAVNVPASERFPRLEGSSGDFPFYNGTPIALSGSQWLLLMASVAVAFLQLALPINWPGGSAMGQLIPAILFPAIPLATLAYTAPGHWRSIFGKVGGREVRLMIGFALLNLVVSMMVGSVVSALTSVTPNASISQLGELDALGKLAFLGKTLPQLLGEEVMTLLPFLALMHLFAIRFGSGRKAAVIGAWVVSSLVFGMLHLPTYDWNWIQCVVIIGSARLVLTLPWILTKNILVSTGAHVINDWLLIGMGLLGAGIAATT